MLDSEQLVGAGSQAATVLIWLVSKCGPLSEMASLGVPNIAKILDVKSATCWLELGCWCSMLGYFESQSHIMVNCLSWWKSLSVPKVARELLWTPVNSFALILTNCYLPRYVIPSTLHKIELMSCNHCNQEFWSICGAWRGEKGGILMLITLSTQKSCERRLTKPVQQPPPRWTNFFSGDFSAESSVMQLAQVVNWPAACQLLFLPPACDGDLQSVG